MPSYLDGTYYLVLVADGFDVIDEVYENNNWLYVTKNGSDIINIYDGVIDDGSSKRKERFAAAPPQKFAPSPNSIVKDERPNTYSKKEIMQLMKHHKESGELNRKIQNYLENRNPAHVRKVRRD